jgi:hypothetical protein
VGSVTLPVYNARGGPQGKGHVTFDRAQSQYLDAGSRTLKIETNGGLTIVAVVRFTGDPGSWERIIDLGSGAGVDNLLLGREATSTNLEFHIYNGGYTRSGVSGVIVQDTWLTVVATYRASTREYWLTVNNYDGQTSSSGTASAALTDTTLSLTWMGRSHWDNDYLNGDVAGVFVVDEYLSTDATYGIADAMMRGVDLTASSCIYR